MAKKRPSLWEGLNNKERQRLTLPGFTPVPSARAGLTALFGMGRGDPHRYSHLKILTRIRWIIRITMIITNPTNPTNPSLISLTPGKK